MPTPNPVQTLLEISGGYCLPRSLHVVAELGVADALHEEPRTASDLARDVGAHPEALGRVLRLLAAHGVFEQENGAFRHSPASRLLRSDHPSSMRALVRMFGLPVNWAAFGAMDHAVKTGRSSAEQVIPGGFWAYFAEHPEAHAIFNAAMTGKAQAHVGAIVASFDFSPFATIADVGGGRGQLLRAVLDAAPAARGILFDLPQVVQESADLASDRLTLQGGSFFTDPLPAADLYVVMEVIHDWPDAESVAILQAIRRAARPNARLLVIEQMVPAGPEPHWSKMLDIHMLALLGGRQRTRQEYEALFASAGWTFEREIDTGADISILVGR